MSGSDLSTVREEPLIVEVVVQADHVDHVGTAAEFGALDAHQHVERLELGQTVTFSRVACGACWFVCDDMYCGVGEHYLRRRTDGTNLSRRDDRRFNQLFFECV